MCAPSRLYIVGRCDEDKNGTDLRPSVVLSPFLLHPPSCSRLLGKLQALRVRVGWTMVSRPPLMQHAHKKSAAGHLPVLSYCVSSSFSRPTAVHDGPLDYRRRVPTQGERRPAPEGWLTFVSPLFDPFGKRSALDPLGHSPNSPSVPFSFHYYSTGRHLPRSAAPPPAVAP